MKLKLSNGLTYGYGADGNRICTGSQMGRRDTVPSNSILQPVKMHLTRLRFIDGCYDQGGAYWGAPENVYWAQSSEVYHFGDSLHCIQLFTRASNRDEARRKVLERIPTATFYR